MVNATAMPLPPGWNQMINASDFNPINASVTAWKASAGGYGWDMASIGIIFIIPTAIYLKSQNLIAAAFGQLIVTMVLHYYSAASQFVYYASYIMIIFMIALPLAYKWLAKGGS